MEVEVWDFRGLACEYAALRSLDRRMCRELSQPGASRLPPYGRRWFAAHCAPDRSSYKNWDTLTLMQRDVPAGFCLLSRERRGGATYLEVFFLAVDPTLRGRGIGGALLRAALKRARAQWGSIEARLHVIEGNPAVRLYEREGFAVTRRKRAYPLPGYTTLRMRQAPDVCVRSALD